MIRLKSLLKEEKSGNPFIDFLLTKIQPVINDIVAQQKEKAEKDGERFSKFEEHIAELTLKYDLLKALGNYTKPSDKLIKGSVSKSHKGSLTIDAIIERDDVEYPLYTEVIYAGGYNIQRLHFRYLTKTKLPKSSSNPEADKVKVQLAKLSKGEKISNEIKHWEARIAKNKIDIEKNSKFTDKQILDKVNADGKFVWPSWEEIVKRDAAKNYNNDEATYNKQKKESEEHSVEYWKRQNIKWKEEDIKTGEKTIAKLKAKLDALANS